MQSYICQNSLLLLVFLCTQGCQSNQLQEHRLHHRRNTAVIQQSVPQGIVTVAGAVSQPNSLAVEPRGITLKEAIAQAGGFKEVLDVYSQSVELLVRLRTKDSDLFISQDFVTKTPVGDFRLVGGDHIEVLEWMKCDLARGLVFSKPEAVFSEIGKPRDPKNILSVYSWARQNHLDHKFNPMYGGIQAINEANEKQFLEEKIPYQQATDLADLFGIEMDRPEIDTNLEIWLEKFVQKFIGR
jgi:hypothetical protein